MPEQPSEEQIKELQEKIKNMSPEELKEFQKKQCIFCQIIAGKVQSKKIFEDDKVIAILDINPANPGHILLFPKEHYTIMPQMPEDEISHIFLSAKALSNAQLRSIGAQGTNIIVANGVAAGQRAQHFMVHIIPRMDNDGIKFELPQKTIDEKELEEIRKKISITFSESQPKEQEAPQVFKKSEKKEVEAEIIEENEDEKEKKITEIPKKQSKSKKKKKTEKKVEVSETPKVSDDAKESPISDTLKTDKDIENDDDIEPIDDEQEPENDKDTEPEDDENKIDLDDIAKVLGAK